MSVDDREDYNQIPTIIHMKKLGFVGVLHEVLFYQQVYYPLIRPQHKTKWYYNKLDSVIKSYYTQTEKLIKTLELELYHGQLIKALLQRNVLTYVGEAGSPSTIQDNGITNWDKLLQISYYDQHIAYIYDFLCACIYTCYMIHVCSLFALFIAILRPPMCWHTPHLKKEPS